MTRELAAPFRERTTLEANEEACGLIATTARATAAAEPTCTGAFTPVVESVNGQPAPTFADDSGLAACTSAPDRIVVNFPGTVKYGIDLLPSSDDAAVGVVIVKLP